MARFSFPSTNQGPSYTSVSSIRNSPTPKFTEFGISGLTALYLRLPKSVYFLCGAYEKLNQALVVIYSCKLLISEMLMLQAVVTVSIKASCSILFLPGSCPIFWPCPLLEQVEMGCDWQLIVVCLCGIIFVHFKNARENLVLIIDFKQEKAMLSFTSKHLCSNSKFYRKDLKACLCICIKPKMIQLCPSQSPPLLLHCLGKSCSYGCSCEGESHMFKLAVQI